MAGGRRDDNRCLGSKRRAAQRQPVIADAERHRQRELPTLVVDAPDRRVADERQRLDAKGAREGGRVLKAGDL